MYAHAFHSASTYSLIQPILHRVLSCGIPNYEDPNINVDLPIFTIHGNHDDPTRETAKDPWLSPLDLMAASNLGMMLQVGFVLFRCILIVLHSILVNYFGQKQKADVVEVYPIIVQKGTTSLALYGLGSIRDERLNAAFRQGKVTFVRPTGDLADEVFSVFVLHQNRSAMGRGDKNCLLEKFIPSMMISVFASHQ